jgi:trimethylamine-N-oxide reductase (cytochrome c)
VGQGLYRQYGPADNLVVDITEHTDMHVIQGGDLETTPWGFRGQFASRLMFFWNKCGIEQVYICPDLNYSAAIHADKWIPILPNTDAALQLAIIYTWVVEGTYDKEYVATHAVGMDKIEAYVLGKVDGVPKTPKWASEKCGVPSYTIKALARHWAKKTVSTGHYFGGALSAGPTPLSRRGLNACCLACRVWASRECTTPRSPTWACRRTSRRIWATT